MNHAQATGGPPPPARHLSRRRSPGTVFLVSRMRAGAAAAAICAVSVAMPLIRCMKLSTTRSATRMLSAAGGRGRDRRVSVDCRGERWTLALKARGRRRWKEARGPGSAAAPLPVIVQNFCPRETRSPSCAPHSACAAQGGNRASRAPRQRSAAARLASGPHPPRAGAGWGVGAGARALRVGSTSSRTISATACPARIPSACGRTAGRGRGWAVAVGAQGAGRAVRRGRGRQGSRGWGGGGLGSGRAGEGAGLG